MLPQVGAVVERLVAELAGEGTLSGVDPHVGLKVRADGEGLVAHLAHVRPGARVDALVALQRAGRGELAVADLTHDPPRLADTHDGGLLKAGAQQHGAVIALAGGQHRRCRLLFEDHWREARDGELWGKEESSSVPGHANRKREKLRKTPHQCRGMRSEKERSFAEEGASHIPKTSSSALKTNNK